MKQRTLATAVLTTACLFLAGSNAQLIPFFNRPQTQTAAASQSNLNYPEILETQQKQAPMSPSDSTNPSQPHQQESPKTNSAIILSDVLGTQSKINIFAGFTRDVASISTRLENPLQNSTVLAPQNSALTALPRKPWENPADYDKIGAEAYKGDEGRDRAYENLRRFTEAHVLPASPWKEGEKVKRVVGGGEVWWERSAEDGKARVMPQGVEVEGVVSRVGNGEVWVLKGVLNYEVE